MCDKTVDCYTCLTIETCPQVYAAFGPIERRNSFKSPKLCANPLCPNPRAWHRRFCLECERVNNRARYQKVRIRNTQKGRSANRS